MRLIYKGCQGSRVRANTGVHFSEYSRIGKKRLILSGAAVDYLPIM